MTEEHRTLPPESAQKEFSIVRKGYDPAEVEQCLAEYEESFRDLEEHAARLKHELNQSRLQVAKLEAAQAESIDSAMAAVFDAKDRIIRAAQERARRIEEDARQGVRLPEEGPVPPAGHDADTQLLAELTAAVGAEGPADGSAHEVLLKMQAEAEVIRNRLDSGLAAAFDQMEQMQRDAEIRARELLAAARLEAARLRSATGEDVAIEVTITDEMVERPSRYSRQSAALPRIHEDDGGSVLAEMADLRSRFRGEQDDEDTVPSHDAAG